MATVYYNVSQLGAAQQGGEVETVVSAGAGQAGAVTIAFDPTLVTLSEVYQMAQDALLSLGDVLK